MTSGRTIWRAKDCEWSTRERVVDLGETFGSAGPLVLDWLEEQAKKQNDAGWVLTGYRAVARGAFVQAGADDAERIVRHAVEIGALDEFQPDPDGRRFRCRVSGHQADQARGKDTIRRHEARLAEADANRASTGSAADKTDPDTTGSTTSCLVPVGTGQERTEEQHFSASENGTVVTFDRRPVPSSVLVLGERILADFNEQAGTRYGAFTGRGKPSEDLKRILGALADADPPLDFDEAQRMTRWRLAHPYWEGRPHTGVVFGPGVFASNRESASGNGTTRSLSSADLGRALSRPAGQQDGAA